MIKVVTADRNNVFHVIDFYQLMKDYSKHEMSGSESISSDILMQVLNYCFDIKNGIIFIAYRALIDPVGFVTCLYGYSTFAGKKTLNIHDIYVAENEASKGIGNILLDRVESHARSHDYCKITLEVRTDNEKAKKIFLRSGFENGGQFGGKFAAMEYWQKYLR